MSALAEGSLCTGYDGLTMGLRLALPDTEIVTRWQAEVDADMSTVLAKHHPGVPNLGDITLTDFAAQPPVDIIAAGFPCQPVSAAGRQQGDADVRWLWPAVHRAILAQRPGAVFLENVMNLVSWQGGRLLRVILDDLRAAGYRSRWTVLGACAVGAPHHRHRWFLVAGHVGPYAPEPERVGKKALCGAPRSGGRALLLSPMARDGDERRGSEGDATYWRTRALTRNNGLPLGAVAALLPSPTASDDTGAGHAAQGGRNLRTTIADLAGHWGRFADAVALWESTTGIPAPEPTIPAAKSDGRRLSPLLPEWMMGLPPGHLTDILGRSPAIKGAGNGVVPLQAAAAWRLLTC